MLAGDPERGSVLNQPDRQELARRLPSGHVLTLDGGHCLHRDAPAEWLAAVTANVGLTSAVLALG